MGRFHSFIILAAISLFCLCLTSCSSREPVELLHMMPPTPQASITFDERQVADDCTLFAQIMVSVPGTLSGTGIKHDIEQFGAQNGADLVLLGLARINNESPETIEFRAYGPKTPYLFKSRWSGWKFGFSDWNKGGELVDFGSNYLETRDVTVYSSIIIQAAMLSCPSLRVSN